MLCPKNTKGRACSSGISAGSRALRQRGGRRRRRSLLSLLPPAVQAQCQCRALHSPHELLHVGLWRLSKAGAAPRQLHSQHLHQGPAAHRVAAAEQHAPPAAAEQGPQAAAWGAPRQPPAAAAPIRGTRWRCCQRGQSRIATSEGFLGLQRAAALAAKPAARRLPPTPAPAVRRRAASESTGWGPCCWTLLMHQ